MALTDKLTAIADAIRVQSGKTDKIPLAQMPDEIINLQSLNFEVVGNPKPQSPKMNTIWVDTDVAIPNWTLSATKPDSGDEGAVCVQTGNGSVCAFNALKKNAVMVYPLCATQRISGAWKNVNAEIYQGEWKVLQAEVVFFGNGKVNTDVFGNVAKSNSGANEYTIVSGNIRFAHYVDVKASKLFDVSSFNTIECTIAEWDYMNPDMHLVDASGNNNNLTCIKSDQTPGGLRTFDISSYSGEYYLRISTGTGGANNSNDVSYSSIKFKA